MIVASSVQASDTGYQRLFTLYSKSKSANWKPSESFPVRIPDSHEIWKKQKRFVRRWKKDRRILVSVEEAKFEKKKRLDMKGWGMVRAPQSIVYAVASDFSKMKDLSDYILESRYQQEQGLLYVHTKAFGYHAHMLFQVKAVETDQEKQIRWRIVQGTFTGMTGTIQIESLAKAIGSTSAREASQSLVSLYAQHDYENLGIPDFFVRFGLEVILEKVSSTIRRVVEEKSSVGS